MRDIAASTATVIVARQRAKRGRARVFVRAAVVAALLWPPAAWLAARGLVVRADLPRADAVAVLSGSNAYVERTRKAAALFGEGRAPVVLLTDDGARGGWSSAEQRNPFFIERAEDELRRSGVPATSIERVPGTVSGTREEALRLREYAERRGLRSLLVVTSAYHTRRARWTLAKVFEGSGVELGLAAAESIETPPPSRWWLEARGWQAVAGEYVKLAYYHARY